MIDVSNIKPASLLAALYNASQPIGMGIIHYNPEPMTDEEAQALLDTHAAQGAEFAKKYGNRGSRATYFDYLKGRVMKVEINGETLDPRLYDRDNGRDAAEMVVLDILTRPNPRAA